MNAANTESLFLKTAEAPLRKKKVLVIYSKGGGGHQAAGAAITEALSPEYEVVLVNGLTEAVPGPDFLNDLTSGRFTGEDFYNFLLRNGWNRLVHLYGKVGAFYMALNKRRMQGAFTRYLDRLEVKPDLIISVIPFVNGGVAPVAIEQDIPFILVPTDLELSTFLVGLSDGSLFKEKDFTLALPYEDPDLKREALQQICLSADQVAVTGFPVRAACLKKYSSEELSKAKDHFNLSQTSQIVTIILGAAGGTVLIEYALEIAQIPDPHVEFNLCAGRNEKLAKKMVKKLQAQGAALIRHLDNCYTLQTENKNILHIRGFIKDLPELMACSDLVISKTGSCSVNEVIYLRKMLLLDDTPGSSSQELPWESCNVPFVKKHHLGDAFTSTHELKSKIVELLHKRRTTHAYMVSDMELPNFQTNLKHLVQKILDN